MKIPQEKWHQSQRGYFAGSLYNAMVDDQDIWLVTGDLGYAVFDKIKEDFSQRFLNVGASEQAGMGICVGLALEGKKPFFYSITNFLLQRPYETIKLYLDGEGVPVRLVGSGRDTDYAHDGPSHDATFAKQLLATLPNIASYFPEEKEEVISTVDLMLKTNKASFISLRR